MELLKKLKFVEYKPNTSQNPALHRRRKLLMKIEEQLLLAQHADYNPTKTIVTVDAEGNKQHKQVPKLVRRWWASSVDGKIQLTVRYGSKALQFAKGKTAIELESEAELVHTLELVKQAVEAGEFDDLLSTMAKGRGQKRKEKV